MPRITLKETISKEIEISMDALYGLIDTLSNEEKARLLEKLKAPTGEFLPFKKDEAESILSDFRGTDLYEEQFLRDLEEGLRKSSVYK